MSSSRPEGARTRMTDDALPTYRDLTSIVPDTAIQFLDFGLDLGRHARVARAFAEEEAPPETDALGTDTAEARVLLRCLVRDEEHGYVDREDGSPREPDYVINASRALEPFLDRWVPLPILRRRGLKPDGRPYYARGPSNWARLRIVEIDEPAADGPTHRLVLALDTAVEEHGADEPYAALSPDDVRTGEEFRLAADEADCGWLLNQPWLDAWLEELFRGAKLRQRGGRPLRPGDIPFACEHLARYLTLLAVLEEAEVFPTLRLIDPGKYTPIEVDLVLDVGNSRTCGLLIESYPDEPTDLNNSVVLRLRDLSRPERTYAEPFESRVEFARATFGNTALSKRSGRRGEAFSWPLVARVGEEAVRLSALSVGAEGATGMSSPKRYLWDTGRRNQDWRFNAAAGDPADDGGEAPVTTGTFVQFVNDEGVPLSHVRRGQAADPAFFSRYSRSSLMMFVLAEIVLQAIVAINAPDQRNERAHADVPRRLRRVIMTLPTAMPIAERRILRNQASWAVELVWASLGWPLKGAPDESVAWRAARPEVVLRWDEASCTQLVYLYAEIAQKFQGDVRTLAALLGRTRGDDDAPSLRVASIDVGGGTTDLIVTHYEAVGRSASAVIRPTQLFREGFNVAGDDILCAVVERHVLPAMSAAMAAAGVDDPRAVMAGLFGGNYGGQSARERTLRRQFARLVAVPAGLALLDRYEEADPLAPPPRARLTLGRLLGDAETPAPVLGYVEHAAAAAGAEGFGLAEVEIEVDVPALDDTVRRVIGPVLADLCEVVHAYGCDVLLLSGRPSRLPGIRGAVLAKMPVPPDRIVSMHRYRVGAWYPFRDAAGRIADPKTTAAVGAMLCTLAEGQIEGFLFQAERLGLRSTARFVGELELSGEIRDDKVFFANLDLDDPRAGLPSHTFEFYAPIFIGFRQLPLARWPAKPLYRLAFGDARAMALAKARLPYRVTLERASEEDEEDFRVTEITDHEGGPVLPRELDLRLQTLKTEEGYWLDTGMFSIV